jgi:endonuclease/exonuclease/phosphatase family metal-dependent hydrolase
MSRLRIATWNLERDDNNSHPVDEQISRIRIYNPDIIVLTETDDGVDLSQYGYHKASTAPKDNGKYCAVIWSKYVIQQSFTSYDSGTAVCSLVSTSLGSLLIYGTIITYAMDGVDNGMDKWEEHINEIGKQGRDWRKLRDFAGGSIPLCVAGDFNQTRCNCRYATKDTHQALDKALANSSLECLTEADFGKEGMLKPDPKKKYPRSNVDHICVTRGFAPRRAEAFAWDHFTESGNFLSDHNGVYVDFY